MDSYNFFSVCVLVSSSMAEFDKAKFGGCKSIQKNVVTTLHLLRFVAWFQDLLVVSEVLCVFIVFLLVTLSALSFLQFSEETFLGSRSSGILIAWQPIRATLAIRPYACFAILSSSEPLCLEFCLATWL